MASGELTVKQRNELLAETTDEVADLVLANNKAQTLALLIARTQGLPMVNVHARYLDQLEHEGWLDRGLEFLPTDKQLAERQAADSGLRTPEFAVMIAYTKNANVAEIMQTDLPDEAVLEGDLIAATSRRRCAHDTSTRSGSTGCDARSRPPSWSTRWSTCRGSRTTIG